MSTIQHSAITGADLHGIVAFTVASTATRNALAVVAGDIGKVARVTADNTFYILTAVAPATWTAMTPSLATVATSGSYADLINTPTIPAAYTLPVATESVLGGVKQGSGVTIAGDGTISAADTYSLPTASATVLGGIKIGSGLSVDGAGVVTVAGGGGSGTVTSVGLAGSADVTVTGASPITSSGAFAVALANTTVVAGTYGTGSQVPVLTVDAKGRVTSATTTPVMGGNGYPTKEHTFILPGLVGLSTGASRYYFDHIGTFTKITIWATTAPTTGPLTIEILKNGTVVATHSLSVGQNKATDLTLAAGYVVDDYMTVNITSAGSAENGCVKITTQQT